MARSAGVCQKAGAGAAGTDKMRPGRKTMRLHALDGLRAVAALIVVAYHLGWANVADALTQQGHLSWGRAMAGLGASGVELFFVLSGVVLLRPYLRAGRPMRAGSYLARRAIRLYPPYVAAWLLAGMTVWLMTEHPTWWDARVPPFDWADWLAQAAIVQAGGVSYNFAWWSLTVEIVFYAVAPLLVAALVRLPPRSHRALLALTVVAAQAIYLAPAGSGLSHLAWQFGSYAACFAAGVSLATEDPPPALAMGAGLAGIAWVLASTAVPALNPHVGYALAYFGLVASAMRSGSALSNGLSSAPMVWLGERSYSLFLTHYSVIFLCNWAVSQLVPSKGLAFYAASRSLAAPGTLLVACLVFHLIERRFAHGLVTGNNLLPPRQLNLHDERGDTPLTSAR